MKIAITIFLSVLLISELQAQRINSYTSISSVESDEKSYFPLYDNSDSTRLSFSDIFYPDNGSAIFLQAKYSYDYSISFFGVQLKRHAGYTDVGTAFWNDQEISLAFAKNNNEDLISMDGNIGFLYFPYTLVIFTVGGGANYTTSLNSSRETISLYPKISFSAGGITVYYSYKFPLKNSLNKSFNNNSITLAFGPAIWRGK